MISKTYKLLIIKRPQNVKDLLSDTVISHSGLTAASLLDDKELILLGYRDLVHRLKP